MKTSAGYKMGMSCAALAASLVVAECVARMIFPPPPRIATVAAGDHDGSSKLKPKARFLLSRSPQEGFVYISTPNGTRLRPNAHIVIEDHALSRRRIEIKTNSLGYRNPEIGEKTGTRLLFLGDSITFGDYLPEAETFVRLIEELAGENSLDWETINAGVGGISLENETAILKETGLALSPDVVVVCYYLNDFLESPTYYIHNVPSPFDRSRLVAQMAQLLPRMQFIVNRHMGREHRKTREDVDIEAWRCEFKADVVECASERKQFYSAVLNSFGDWGGAWSEHSWHRVLPHFALIRKLACEYGFVPVFVAFPVRAQVEALEVDDYPQKRLSEIAASMGAPFLDILPVLRRANASGDRTLFYDQCHHTPDASRLIAASIYNFLVQCIGNSAQRSPSYAGRELDNMQDGSAHYQAD